MEYDLKSSSSSRYVIEDSIPKVTSDGEPHEVMTIVAMISGLIAAVIVLFVLFSLIGSRRRSHSSPEQGSDNTMKTCKPNETLIPMFTNKQKSVDDERSPKLVSIVTISGSVPVNEATVDAGFNFCQTSDQLQLEVSSLPGISTVCC